MNISDWKNPILEKHEKVKCVEILPKNVVDYLHKVCKKRTNTDQLNHALCNWEEGKSNYKARKTMLRKFLNSMVKSNWYMNAKGYYCKDTYYAQRVNNKDSERKNTFRRTKCRLIPTPHEECLGSLPKVIRSTLCKGIYKDLDFVNCHPTILHQYIEKYPEYLTKNESLDYYIHNREKTLKKIAKEIGLEIDTEKKYRSIVKTKLLLCINKAPTNENTNFIKKELKVNKEDSLYYKFYKDMRKNHIEFYNKMTQIEEFSEFKKLYNKNKPMEEQWNVMGSTINYFLLHQENRCLQALVEKLTKMNIVVSVLCYDGCMILNEYDDLNDTWKEIQITPDMIKELEDYIYEKTTYRMKVEEKPFHPNPYPINEDVNNENNKSKKVESIFELVDQFMEDYFDRVYLFNNERVYFWNESTALWESTTDKFTIGVYISERLRAIIEKMKNHIVNIPEETMEYLNLKINLLSKIKTCEDLGKAYMKNVKYKSHPYIEQEFNRKFEYLIPIKGNKVIDARTLKISDRKPEHFFTFSVNRNIQIGLENSNFDEVQKNYKYIDDFVKTYFYYVDEDFNKKFDSKTYECFCKAIGYSLTAIRNPNENLQKLFFIYGISNTGKSTLFNIFYNIFNCQSFCNVINESILVQTKGSQIKTEYEPLLNGIRLGFCDSECTEENNIDSSSIKKLTGGAPIDVRRMYSRFNGTLINITKMWFFSNFIPKFKKKDKALQNRLMIFPFCNEFDKYSEDYKQSADLINKFNNDPSYKDDMFNWCIIQIHKFSKTQKLETSKRMDEHKAQIIDELNKIGYFTDLLYNTFDNIEEFSKHNIRNLLDEKRAMTSKEFYEVYLQTCEEINEKEIFSRKQFETYIKDYVPFIKKCDIKRGGERIRSVYPITLDEKLAYKQEEIEDFESDEEIF